MEDSAITAEPPQTSTSQGVFVVTVQIAGSRRLCRKFARELAQQNEVLYRAFVERHKLALFDLHYNFNLAQWERV